MVDSHKVWLIASISIAILIIAGLVFVPMMQGNFAGEGYRVVSLPFGSDCMDSSYCASGVCYNNICSGAGIGFFCMEESNCLSGSCEHNVCTGELQSTGNFCMFDSHCVSQFCENNICSEDSTPTEICNNNLDDDGDNKIDCLDIDCVETTDFGDTEICPADDWVNTILVKEFGLNSNSLFYSFSNGSAACSFIGLDCLTMEEKKTSGWESTLASQGCDSQTAPTGLPFRAVCGECLGEEITFADEDLENAIRFAINKNNGPICLGDSSTLYTLNAGNKDISNLGGIENFNKLENLILSANQITNISLLSQLTNLKTLSLSFNANLDDISPLACLNGLTTLNLLNTPLNVNNVCCVTSVINVNNQMTNLILPAGVSCTGFDDSVCSSYDCGGSCGSCGINEVCENNLCVVEKIDSDGDSILDVTDNCPLVPNPSQEDADTDGLGNVCDDNDDTDNLLDIEDNCPLISNPDQVDTDEDLIGNVCDTDDDNDNVLDGKDNCPLVSNPDQVDTDEDLIGNVCDTDDDNDNVLDGKDNCPLVPNPDQVDTDEDDFGDACDTDDDDDGVLDINDDCPKVSGTDGGCVPIQEDLDDDGIIEGDLCPDQPGVSSYEGCLLGDSDYDGCISFSEYIVFNGKYQNNIEEFHTTFSFSDYIAFIAKYINNVGGIQCPT